MMDEQQDEPTRDTDMTPADIKTQYEHERQRNERRRNQGYVIGERGTPVNPYNKREELDL